jgi:hypothetical protein
MTEPRRSNRGRTTTLGAIADVGGTDDAARIQALEARLARLEGAPGIRERGRGLMARVVPAEAGQHFRNAGREQLLGVRSIVDFWIRRLDEADSRATRHASRDRETIEIE